MIDTNKLNKGDKVYCSNTIKELLVTLINYESGGIRIWTNDGNWYPNDELYYTKGEAIFSKHNFEGLSTCDLLDIRDSINKEIQNRENELL